MIVLLNGNIPLRRHFHPIRFCTQNTNSLNQHVIQSSDIFSNKTSCFQNGTITAILPMNPSVENVFTPPKVITDNLEKRKYIPKAKVFTNSEHHNTVYFRETKYHFLFI